MEILPSTTHPEVPQPPKSFLYAALRSWYDWAFLVALMPLMALSEYVVTGRNMYITDDMLQMIRFPNGASTVPSWSVAVLALIGPFIVMTVHRYLANVPVYVHHSGVLGCWLAVLITGVVTNVLKLEVRCADCSLPHASPQTTVTPYSQSLALFPLVAWVVAVETLHSN
jgi:hypothetical protein